ncbi:MAG: hypothetical protein IPK84_03165 [Candidatus Moraniibacteriota bacterium]|nr:MAG: hypothetical protein IPK84_03165 [Candidatus Moranbacteria bacterium]
MNSLELLPKNQDDKRDPRGFYPERPSDHLEEKIRALADFDSGRGEKIQLSFEEREEIKNMEDLLGDILESISDISPRSSTFYSGYLLTEAGRKDFEKITGISLESTGNTQESIRRFLYEATPIIAHLSSKERMGIAGRSQDYSDTNLFTSLIDTADHNGTIRINNVLMPDPVKIHLDTEKNVEKILKLRQFKEKIKRQKDSLKKYPSSPKQETLLNILQLYQSRVNEMIAESTSSIFDIERKAELLGHENLTEAEKSALELIRKQPETNLSRYDKFIHGVVHEETSSGWRQQVGEELSQFASEIEEESYEGKIRKRENIVKKNLDPEKIGDETAISEENLRELAEETLRSYDLLSNQPASEYDPDRIGPAPDNKWQFITRKEITSMSVNGKKKIIQCGTSRKSVVAAISIALAHEIEGHVLQYENRSKIPLRLFKKLGSGRSLVFAECGAMNNQDIVSKEAFGFNSPPHPHYIRAMQKKIDGGNYLDCVKEFYESAMKIPRQEKSAGTLSDEDFKKEMRKNLRLSINRSQRLFKDGSDLSSQKGFLAKSKDTVYLEQVRLFRELKKHGLEKYVFIGGANLNALTFLLRSGFLNPEDIKTPKYYCLKIWERMKDQFILAP